MKTAVKWLIIIETGLAFILASSATGAFLWLLALAREPGPVFRGSPERMFSEQRSSLNLKRRGSSYSAVTKLFRTTDFLDGRPSQIFFRPHQRSGWLVLGDSITVRGRVLEMHDGPEGDALFHVRDVSQGFKYGDSLKIEVDENIRFNFPVLYDLEAGDSVLVSGRWVIDWAHGNMPDHYEIHPASWIEILKKRD